MYTKRLRYLLAALFAASYSFADDEAATSETVEEVAPIEETAPVAEETAPVEVSEEELVELIGYLTAQGQAVFALQLDEAGVADMTSGFKKALSGEIGMEDLAQLELELAFGEAQARAEAAELGVEELPTFSEGSLEKIGVVIHMQSGLSQLGFGADDAELIGKGFAAGASDPVPFPELEAMMPALQEYIQVKAMAAQEELLRAQEVERLAALAEFEEYAVEWREKENFNVVLETTQGDVTIELMPSVAPLAVANFVGHIENGYYDGLVFHRIIKDFMVQGGDPLGNGTGGESVWGRDFPDEFDPEVRFDEEGLLAMANAGPMTNGSQFFITTSQPEWLNDRHTIFGKVVEGYENVKALEAVETGAGDVPVEEQKIIKAYVAE